MVIVNRLGGYIHQQRTNQCLDCCMSSTNIQLYRGKNKFSDYCCTPISYLTHPGLGIVFQRCASSINSTHLISIVCYIITCSASMTRYLRQKNFLILFQLGTLMLLIDDLKMVCDDSALSSRHLFNRFRIKNQFNFVFNLKWLCDLLSLWKCVLGC